MSFSLKKEDISAYTILFVILSVYTYIQTINFTPAYLEVDPDGYLFLAKRFAEFKSPGVKDDDPFMYQSHVWVENEQGEVVPKFAPGYPFLMSIAYRLGGDTAMFLVSPIMGGLALIGSFMLFRMWMSRSSALFGVSYLAVNGMILVYCNYLLTHASDLCFVVWGMFFLWRWKRDIGQHSGVWAGLLLGGAMTIRHTSGLFLSALICAIVARWTNAIRSKTNVKSLFLKTGILLGCYCFFPLLLAIYNWTVFGSPLTTGYDLSGEQTAFNLKNIIKNASVLAFGLNRTGLFLMFPMGIVGMFLSFSIAETIMVLLWVLPIFFLYSSYYWAPDGIAYYRFLISTFPAFVGSACTLMDRPKLSWIRKGISYILLMGAVVYITYPEVRGLVEGTVSNYPSRSLADLSKRTADILNDDAVLFSRWPAFCYICTRRHFRHYDLNIFTSSYGTSSFAENIEPKRQQIRNDRLREFYRGLTDADLQKKKVELVFRFLSEGRQVAFLLPQHAVKAEQQALGEEFKWNILGSWISFTRYSEGAWQGELWELYEIKIRASSHSDSIPR